MYSYINVWAILVAAVATMVMGAIWYGPIFGKTWAKLIGADGMSPEECKKMQKKATPLYLLQFALALVQIFFLAHITGFSWQHGMATGFLVWFGFVMPTIAGSVMWTNEPRKQIWKRFAIQACFQFLVFLVAGFILGLWL